MIVYGSSLSPYVRKVIVICAEKGIAVENEVFGPGVPPTPAFTEASPFGKIPALRDGDYTLADSSAIAHYLEAAHPTPAMIPTEPKARGQVIWFDEFADTLVFGTGVKIFFNRIVGPLIGAPFNLDVAAKAEAEELPPQLAYLERVAPGEGGFLVGDGFTLADAAIASMFVNYQLAGGRICDETYPRFCAYLKRIHDRPSFQSLIKSHHGFLDSVRERLPQLA